MHEESYFSSDAAFHKLYPAAIRLLAHRHWTSLDVAKKAAEYLAAEGKPKILDIGSGVGKFCLAAAFYKPRGMYYGIEQRENLINHAEAARKKLNIKNVEFIRGNFTKINFQDYDHFYFYNSFYENLSATQQIDTEVEYSRELYELYNFILSKQLSKMPMGTKLVTFHMPEEEMPEGFHIVGTDMDGYLNFLVKI